MSEIEATTTTSKLIIGVRFMTVGKVYHFDASEFPHVRPGDRVIVDTARGRQLGEVVNRVDSTPTTPPEDGYKPIEGLATPRDLAQQQFWQGKEPEALASCRERSQQLELREIKIVRAEYSYDGARLTFLICGADENGKPETKSLRDDMQNRYPNQQVALRQIGPRDTAKHLGGLGACGLEVRCCSRFLTEFNPVSIKMAKEQGISLNPEEITGMCGRLRCCLDYECALYSEARKHLPKRGKQVLTPKGPGKVTDVNPLKETVFVAIRESDENTRVYEIANSDIQLATEPEPPPKNAPVAQPAAPRPPGKKPRRQRREDKDNRPPGGPTPHNK